MGATVPESDSLLVSQSEYGYHCPQRESVTAWVLRSHMYSDMSSTVLHKDNVSLNPLVTVLTASQPVRVWVLSLSQSAGHSLNTIGPYAEPVSL